MTTNDLKRLGKLIDERLNTKLDEKLEPINKKLDRFEQGQQTTRNETVTKKDIQRVEQKIERVEQKIVRDAETIADFFNETWEKMERSSKESNERVSIIEDHLGLTTPKN